MIEHLCHGKWRPGEVALCPRHARPGRAPNLTPFERRSHTSTEGIAKTGQVSSKGTVSHREHFDGRVDAHAAPTSFTAKLSEMKEQHERR